MIYNCSENDSIVKEQEYNTNKLNADALCGQRVSKSFNVLLL